MQKLFTLYGQTTLKTVKPVRRPSGDSYYYFFFFFKQQQEFL